MTISWLSLAGYTAKPHRKRVRCRRFGKVLKCPETEASLGWRAGRCVEAYAEPVAVKALLIGGSRRTLIGRWRFGPWGTIRQMRTTPTGSLAPRLGLSYGSSQTEHLLNPPIPLTHSTPLHLASHPKQIFFLALRTCHSTLCRCLLIALPVWAIELVGCTHVPYRLLSLTSTGLIDNLFAGNLDPLSCTSSNTTLLIRSEISATYLSRLWELSFLV
jgi:hypothetical protein